MTKTMTMINWKDSIPDRTGFYITRFRPDGLIKCLIKFGLNWCFRNNKRQKVNPGAVKGPVTASFLAASISLAVSYALTLTDNSHY